MAKVTFEFDMQEDREDMEIMTQAHTLYGQAQQFQNWLQDKVDQNKHDESTLKTLKWVYQVYNDYLGELID